MKLFYIFVPILCVILTEAQQNTSSSTTQDPNTQECASIILREIPTNLNSGGLESNFTSQIWKAGVFKNQTPLLKKLQDILIKMVKSNSAYFNALSLQFTYWAAALFPYARELYPSFCPMARLINQTVEWRESGDTETYLQSLNSLSVSATYLHSMIKYVVLKQQGCKDIEIPKSPPRDCWENGLVSKLDSIIELYGELLPWPLYGILHKLAASDLFEERASATLMGLILVPTRNVTLGRVDITVAIEFYGLVLASTGKRLPVCCCKLSKERTSYLVNFLDDNVYTSIDIEIEKINNTCA